MFLASHKQQRIMSRLCDWMILLAFGSGSSSSSIKQASSGSGNTFQFNRF